MPLTPPLRQVGSLKDNSKGCRGVGIRWAQGMPAIIHGDNTNKLAAGAHNNSLEPGETRLLLNSNQEPGASHLLLLNSNRLLHPMVAVVHHSRPPPLIPGHFLHLHNKETS